MASKTCKTKATTADGVTLKCELKEHDGLLHETDGRQWASPFLGWMLPLPDQTIHS